MKNIGVLPVYKREDWPRWQKLCGDMSSSYDAWLMDRLQLLKNLKSRGLSVDVAEIDLDAYVEWAASEKLPINEETRNRFAMHVFSRRSDNIKN